MNRILSLAAGIILILAACSGPNQQGSGAKEEQAKKMSEQVMNTHDEAMKFSSLVLKLKLRINDKIDSLNETNGRDVYQKVSSQLYAADQEMLNWMRNYKEPNLSADTALAYLQSEYQKILKVKSLTDTSIANAKKLLNEK
jgi:predicted membrane chloride channel (bestrophin family)